MSIIASIQAIHLSIPFTHDGPPAGFLGEVWTHHEILLVEVTTSDGLVGYGECFGFTGCRTAKTALERQLAPLLIGQSADDVTGLMARVARTLHVFGRSGAVLHALSGLDIALWDIAGKRAGLSLARLLGGGLRDCLPAYASKLNIGEPLHVGHSCEAALRRGYRSIKLHERTVEAVAAARSAIGAETMLTVDVNCAWTYSEALAAARSFAPYDIGWLEEPIWPPEDHQSLSRLRLETGIRMAVGENLSNPWEFSRIVQQPAIDILQPSVIKIGGVSGFLQAAHAIRLAGREIAPHSPYLGPGLLATMQMAAVFPEIGWIEHYAIDLECPLYPAIERVDRNGNFSLPQGAGLGADPEPKILEQYRVG